MCRESPPTLDAKTTHIIDGQCYDLSTFEHPGGKQFLHLSEGLDITRVVHSNHLDWESKHVHLLKRFLVGAAAADSDQTMTDPEYLDMKRTVASLLRKHQSTIRRYHVYLSIFLILAHVGYLLPFLFPLVGLPYCTAVWILYFFSTLVLGGQGHEEVHQNNGMGYTLTMVGFMSADWMKTHTLVHHPDTNEVTDAELELMEFVRSLPFPAMIRSLIASVYVGVSFYFKGFVYHCIGIQMHTSAMDKLALAFLWLQLIVVWFCGGLTGLFVSRSLTGFWFVACDLANHFYYDPKTLATPRDGRWHLDQIAYSQDVIITGSPFCDSVLSLSLSDQTLHHLHPRLRNAEVSAIRTDYWKYMEKTHGRKPNELSWIRAIGYMFWW